MSEAEASLSSRVNGPNRLAARGLTLAYEERTVVQGLDLAVPDGQVTVIVGPNACGKSTTLRALGRLLKPRAGAVLLDGEDVAKLPTRQVAQSVGLLPQSPTAPEAITVADLVSRGRQPHQRWWQQWSEEDERAVVAAMAHTNVSDLADRSVDELSGGQRQRVWIAMALAQETDLLLLDEPTTFLDIAHQVEVLDLIRRLNHERGRTVVIVLHDLNQAARYADHLVAMKGGRIVAEGHPREIVTAELVREVFGLESVVVPCPVTGSPLVVPGSPYTATGGPTGDEGNLGSPDADAPDADAPDGETPDSGTPDSSGQNEDGGTQEPANGAGASGQDSTGGDGVTARDEDGDLGSRQTTRTEPAR